MSRCFDDTFALSSGTKNSVSMLSIKQGVARSLARPKGRIVGKDSPRESYEDIAVLPSRDFVVGYRGGYADSPCGTQIRRCSDLSVLVEIDDIAGPFDIGRYLLGSGPLYRGVHSSLRIVDYTNGSIVRTVPLCEPFLWMPEQRLIGQTPLYLPDLQPHLQVEPALLQAYPQLKELIEQPDRKLIVLNSSYESEVEILASDICSEFPEFVSLALAPDNSKLYAATCRSVGAIDLSTNQVLWTKPLGKNFGERFFACSAMALSLDGNYLALGGLAGDKNKDNSLVVLSAIDGAKVLDSSSFHWHIDGDFRAMVWHESGWLAAGTNRGQLCHVDLCGAARFYKAAGRVIESMLFRGDDLILCTREAQFRIIPLLADERSP